MIEIFRWQNKRTFPTMFLLASLLDALADIYQIALVDESQMIKNQFVTHKRSENGRSAWDALYETTS
jgi:hypothetical protein